MPDSLETRLDQALKLWRDRRLRDSTMRAREKQCIEAQHTEHRRQAEKFATTVRTMVRNSIMRANRHVAKRKQKCELRDISGIYTGSLHLGNLICNPIAFEFCTLGSPVGYPLIIELTADSRVAASIAGYPGANFIDGTQRNGDGLSWVPVPLDQFDQAAADDIVASYVAAVIALACPEPEDGTHDGRSASAAWL